MENRQLTLGSLFSGSGGFELGGVLSGIEPIWNSEIEPFAVAVTNKRFPTVKHYGDISAMDGSKIEPVDIITGGFPCQSVSIAGRREGVKHIDHGGDKTTRSGLFYEAIRIVNEMRGATNGEKPRYLVVENVPGLFSSNQGEDFRAILEEICAVKDECVHIPRPEKWRDAGEIVGNGYSVAWRVMDAQLWGVPQRRKRIFLVADFAGGSAGKILFESEGLSGYTPQGFRAWQGAAGAVEESSGETGRLCLNDQGGERMDVTDDMTSTLRAGANHPPVIMDGRVSAAFCAEESAQSRSIGYEEETSPTLRAGAVPAAVALDYHPADSRIGISDKDVTNTLTQRMGTGGNNVNLVMCKIAVPVTMKIRAGGGCGGKGILCQTDKSATLACNNDQTVFVPKAYGICSKESNAMKSDNPKSGIYEAETVRTIDTSNQSPNKNQGGIAVIEGNGSRPSHHGNGYKESEVMYTLNTVEQHSVAYGIDRAAFNQGRNALFGITVEEEVEPPIVARGPGAVAHPTYCTSKNSHHTIAEKELASTLVASDYKDPPMINDDGVDAEYIVRRLTPKECASLQGFPMWWCCDLGIENPNGYDIAFWREVFETHRKIVTKATKPKTDKQIIKWLKNPHSDAAEYKLWGNGCALPCIHFVLAGIAWAAEQM